MTYSQNEIEALCKKAAKGAGYHWGLAEEAGKTARWLTSFQLSGAELLADLLVQNDGQVLSALTPKSHSMPLTSGDENPLCPIIAGSVLNDANQLPAAIEGVSHPLLILPAMAGMALRLEQVLCAQWDGITICTDGTHLYYNVPPSELLNANTTNIRIATADHTSGKHAPRLRGDVTLDAWQTLNRLAHRTYAPSTEESRLRGAGAGLSDND